VYNRRRAPRIYATDHTGLLDRGDRERKEHDFKFRPRVDSLNVLVATSTLEMGIDIGDLNVTINTSVPPLTVKFLATDWPRGTQKRFRTDHKLCHSPQEPRSFLLRRTAGNDGRQNTYPGLFPLRQRNHEAPLPGVHY